MDKYDEAIAYLTEHPDEIEDVWDHAIIEPVATRPRGWELFQAAGDHTCGCLTQIREGCDVAATQSLTEAIRADDRIPIFAHDITLAHLPYFAEWQRRLDKELGR